MDYPSYSFSFIYNYAFFQNLASLLCVCVYIYIYLSFMYPMAKLWNALYPIKRKKKKNPENQLKEIIVYILAPWDVFYALAPAKV